MANPRRRPAPASDQPEAPAAPVPAFAQPISDPLPAEDLTSQLPPSPTSPSPSANGRAAGGSGPAPGAPAAAARAPGSTPAPPTSELAEGAVTALVGILGICGLAAAALLRRYRRGAALRTPTDAQYEQICAPLARVFLRHVPLDLAPKLVLDLADAGMSARAVARYAEAGPLLSWPTLEPTTAEG